MSKIQYHLAQFNITRMIAPIDDPLMAGFTNQLDPINAIADQSPGFVWRLQDETGHAMEIRAFDDDMIAVNMSVWESLEALSNFVYRSNHAEVYRNRKKWLTPFDPSYVLWWIPAGHIPSVEEGKARLEMLSQNGPTPDAFTFGKSFSPQSGLQQESNLIVDA